MSNHEEGIAREEYFARLDAGIPYEGPVIGLGYAIKEIIVIPIPVNESQTQTFWDLNCMNVVVPYSYEHLEEEKDKDEKVIANNSEIENNRLIDQGVKIGMRTINLTIGGISTYYIHKGEYLRNNELWRVQQKGTVVTRMTKMKNGQSLWKNYFEKDARKKHLKTVSKARNIGTKVSVIGGLFISADIILTGEIKLSHAINAGLIGASATTGVGAIVAGVWFIADFGTMGVNYLMNGDPKGLGDMLDERVGTLNISE